MTALGSGLYSPSGPLNFTYNTTGGSELIVAEVPILSAGRKVRPRREEGRRWRGGRTGDPGLWENITAYSRAPLLRGRHEVVTLCHGETFCCEASYHLQGDSYHLPADSYHLLAYKGLRDMAIPGLKIPIEVCGVVLLCCPQPDLCTVCPPGGETAGRFDYLRLTSGDYERRSLVLPSVLHLSGQLADWNKIAFDRIQSDEGEHKLLLNSSIF